MTALAPTDGWVLVTNDDGIDGPGLRTLAAAAAGLGLDVVVAAPAQQASGAGSSLLANRIDGVVPVERRELADLDGIPTYSVAAQPAFISFAAMNGWFDTPPALVLSGINWGANLGHAILHSGTVGAAVTAGRLGVRALAVSLDCDHLPPGAEERWDTAAALLPAVLAVLAGTPPGGVLSLNVPNLPFAELGELRGAPLAAEGRWRPHVRVVDGGLRVSGERRSGPLEPDSDASLLSAGHPTLTAVSSLVEDVHTPLVELLDRLDRRPA